MPQKVTFHSLCVRSALILAAIMRHTIYYINRHHDKMPHLLKGLYMKSVSGFSIALLHTVGSEGSLLSSSPKCQRC